MLAVKEERYIECSPDAVVTLEIGMFPELEDVTELQGFENHKLVLASV